MKSSDTGITEKDGDLRGKTAGSKKTQFQAGNKGGKARVIPDRVEEDFDRLKAMRHVLTNPKSTDKSEGEKACRAWLEKYPGQFMEALDRLEAEAKKTAAGTTVADSEAEIEPKESDEELEEAINELLAKHRRK